MARNRGKRLERLLSYVHQLYRNRGEADITKKEVATKLDRRSGQIIYLARENFDFEGVLKGGRAIGVEAKETNGQTRLYVDPKGKSGLKVHQIDGLIRWGRLGAIAGVIFMSDWDCAHWISWRKLDLFMKTIYGKPDKSIKLDWVKQNCPEIMRDGLIDYKDIAIQDDAGSSLGGQKCL